MSSQTGPIFAVLLVFLLTFVAAQDVNETIVELAKTQIWSLIDQYRGPDLPELAPFTENERSVTIPDYSQSDLLFRFANYLGLPPFKGEALELWTSKVPRSPRSQPLYDVATWLSTWPGYDALASQAVENQTVAGISLSMDPTTLTGMINFWFMLAPLAIWSNDCDCRGNDRQGSTQRFMPDFSFVLLQNFLYVQPSPRDPPESGWTSGKQHSKDCSPRFFASGRLQLNTYSSPNFLFPATRDIVQAQFDMIADLLRNETAIPILETMTIKPKVKDEVGLRIMKVAGLPGTALSNMRGWLTIRQYALYQALHRGDNNCPIPVTTCGKHGLNPCDVYPPK